MSMFHMLNACYIPGYGQKNIKAYWHVHTAIFKMDNQQGPTV